jgi:hypothetical protein
MSSSQRSARLVLLSIIGIPVTMFLAASWLWYFVSKGDIDLIGTLGTSNNGTFINPPISLREQGFRDDTGTPWVWDDLEPRWTLVVTHDGPTCNAECATKLFLTRQLHIALGKEFNRVRRALVTTAPVKSMRITPIADPSVLLDDAPLSPQSAGPDVPLMPFIAEHHPGLVALHLPPADYPTAFSAAASPSTWYLVDPAGWVMMSFDDTLDYKAILSDLKFLLKNSAG